MSVLSGPPDRIRMTAQIPGSAAAIVVRIICFQVILFPASMRAASRSRKNSTSEYGLHTIAGPHSSPEQIMRIILCRSVSSS